MGIATHPWLLQIDWTRPGLGPNTIVGLELTMSGLADMPMRDQEKLSIISALEAFVAGSVRPQIMYELAAEGTGVSDDADRDTSFALGVRHLLDGIEVDVARRTASDRGF